MEVLLVVGAVQSVVPRDCLEVSEQLHVGVLVLHRQSSNGARQEGTGRSANDDLTGVGGSSEPKAFEPSDLELGS